MGELRERGGERLLLQYVPDRRRFAFDKKVSAKPGAVCELGKLLVRQTRLAARDRITLAGLTRWRSPAARRAATLPPLALAASSASIQPPTAPGTVSAASGPRGGIVS